ncbi:MAG: hypothetical protein ACUVSQ_12190, partial [Pseudanabaenaceae cyanobacterium]
ILLPIHRGTQLIGNTQLFNSDPISTKLPIHRGTQLIGNKKPARVRPGPVPLPIHRGTQLIGNLRRKNMAKNKKKPKTPRSQGNPVDWKLTVEEQITYPVLYDLRNNVLVVRDTGTNGYVKYDTRSKIVEIHYESIHAEFKVENFAEFVESLDVFAKVTKTGTRILKKWDLQ